MTVVVTRDVPMRFRGFLASCMLEIAPGVYTAPKMNRAVRERVWAALEEWFYELGGGGIVMTWLEPLGQRGFSGAQEGSAARRRLVLVGWPVTNQLFSVREIED